MRTLPRIASVAAALTLSLVALGCGQERRSPLGIPNQPPTVTLTSTSAGASGAGDAAHALRWSGTDPDGRVDCYLVTTDLRAFASETGWTRAEGSGRLLTVHRASRAFDEEGPRAIEPAFFAVRAVDEGGAISAPAVRAFFADNVAPEVRITQPLPYLFGFITVQPNTRIMWQGNDPDGAVPSQLARYKFKLFGPGSEFPISLALWNPDSLRRFYAPAFVGWDSVPGESLGVTLRGLQPGQEYLFVLVGFDVAGDYSPVFSTSSNMVRLRAIHPGTAGPRITVFGEGFYSGMASGGMYPDSMNAIVLKSPARAPVAVSWFAKPLTGAHMAAYRWAIDIADPNDESPRRFPFDVARWSSWSLTTTSAIVTPLLPLPPNLTRRLFIEALDSNGFKSRVALKVDFLNVRRDRPTLVVLDTRFPLENQGAGGRTTPVGMWPNAGEIDSFLVARGGVPWQGYPAGTMSTPGLFSGYDFDIYRTRSTVLDKTVPLDLLLRYKNVVWITDAGVSNGAPPGGSYSLRYMSGPSRQNTLVAYANGGGRIWVVGGGGAYAMSRDMFNNFNNDTYAFTYSSTTGELVPGRPMWELAHWRSEFSVYTPSSRLVTKVAPALGRPGVPDYSGLPATLVPRSRATDPIPPQRQIGAFFPLVRPICFEYLTKPNVITESCFPWPGRPAASVLDTLYLVSGVYPPNQDLPCMTVYRGNETGQVVFTGFDLWSWSRPQCRALVDAVLRDIWHLTPTTEAPGIAVLDEGAAGEDGEALIRR